MKVRAVYLSILPLLLMMAALRIRQFQYEMTGYLTFDQKSPNVLVVRADSSSQPARFTVTAASAGLAGSSVVIDVGQVLDLPSPRRAK